MPQTAYGAGDSVGQFADGANLNSRRITATAISFDFRLHSRGREIRRLRAHSAALVTWRNIESSSARERRRLDVRIEASLRPPIHRRPHPKLQTHETEHLLREEKIAAVVHRVDEGLAGCRFEEATESVSAIITRKSGSCRMRSIGAQKGIFFSCVTALGGVDRRSAGG